MSHRNGMKYLSRRAFAVAGTTALLCASLPAMASAKLAVRTQDVTVATPDGKAEAVLFQPSARGHYPAVLLWPDLAGVRPVFRDIGSKIAEQGFIVLLPNTYYRSAKISPVELSAADPETRKRLMGYRATATDDGIVRDGIAYIAFLDRQKHTARERKAGTVGYDVGASYAFRTAAAQPDRIGAVASIYGLGVATPHPDSPHLLVPKSKAAYFVAQAKDDDTREPGDKDDIRAKIAEGGLTGTVEVYPANHGWAVPGSRAYDQASANRALTETIKLLKTSLK
jgi:carboxymethylenebutenolidase